MVFALRDGVLLHRAERELPLIPLDDEGHPVREYAPDGSGKYATIYRDERPSGRVAAPITVPFAVLVLGTQGHNVGADCARAVLALANELGILIDTGAVLKPVAPGSRWEGGRKAHKSELRSFWWPLYEITFNRFSKRKGHGYSLSASILGLSRADSAVDGYAAHILAGLCTSGVRGARTSMRPGLLTP